MHEGMGGQHTFDLVVNLSGIPLPPNLTMAVREWEDQVIFLHRIVEGGTDRSYGIHVARLAGIPRDVLDRARQLLGELAVHHVGKPRLSRHRKSDRIVDDAQLPLFTDPAPDRFSRPLVLGGVVLAAAGTLLLAAAAGKAEPSG